MGLLNTLSPNFGAKKTKRRVGRGIGSGLGKTCSKGHKGQKSRSGGYRKINFEGGQMPIQRRMPKMGFKSKSKPFFKELTLSEINKAKSENISLESLKAEKIIEEAIKVVKVIKSGVITRPLIIKGISVTKGAKEDILKSGGSFE